MENFYSYQLTNFNLQEQVNLGGKFGLLKILKSDDGKLVLISDADFGIIDQNNPTPAKISNLDAALGFVLDIGIRREKQLTIGNGFYFGGSLIPVQSEKPIGQKNFDEPLFEKIVSSINTNYQSPDKLKEAAAIRMNYLLETYNNARLLFPNFYNESYLNLMKIIDAISKAVRAFGFATAVAQVSTTLNEDIYKKIIGMSTYTARVRIAQDLFNELLQFAQTKGFPCATVMATFDENQKFIFSCFYSAYQYRNKFVHHGLPFPHTVKETWDHQSDSGVNYLHPAEGISFIKRYNPQGLEQTDSLDIHSVVEDAQEVSDFKNKYFKLIPTWHFIQRLTKEALLKEINNF